MVLITDLALLYVFLMTSQISGHFLFCWICQISNDCLWRHEYDLRNLPHKGLLAIYYSRL